ncbi:MAG: PP2C family protein-serine/threonine phosphatase [Streptosporangiaceae bacterium]|jgi:protein phosphatase
MTLALHYALRSDVGLLREGNEDSAYAGPHLLAIADGMGGHAAGEVASAVAISALVPLDADRPPDGEMLGALAAAVASANGTLHEMSVADPSVEGMGTTLTAMLWSDTQVALCHIGDSRAYLLRDGDFFQITRDHTLVQSLVDEGRLTPQAAATHPQRSLVMRALQSSTEAEPDLSMREARLGDRYVLCSDGLSDVVTEQTLHKTLVTVADPEDAVGQLIELAIRSGGPDNITCIVADVVDTVTGPVAPSRGHVLAGAAANGGGAPRLRDDSPAGRAHLLAQGYLQAGDLTNHRQPAGERAADSGEAGEADGADGEDLADSGPSRRRWPVVTTILAVLILVIAVGGYSAWRYTQTQYYVGSDGRQVIIYRGIAQKVAGLSLSSVYQRTGIPLSHVSATEASQLPLSTDSLADARRTVQNIRFDYNCEQANLRLQQWEANKPKPVTGKKPAKPAKPYPPAPVVPANCPALGIG